MVSLSLEHPAYSDHNIVCFTRMLTALLLCPLLRTSRRLPKPVLLSLKPAQLPVLGSTRMYRDLSGGGSGVVKVARGASGIVDRGRLGWWGVFLVLAGKPTEEKFSVVEVVVEACGEEMEGEGFMAYLKEEDKRIQTQVLVDRKRAYTYLDGHQINLSSSKANDTIMLPSYIWSSAALADIIQDILQVLDYTSYEMGPTAIADNANVILLVTIIPCGSMRVDVEGIYYSLHHLHFDPIPNDLQRSSSVII
ncbi:hypothetical protein Tco_0751576 [Tanacetum coccineum]|uniref:Uncharacterized protein n=1 Tax=Tanacetum coccineum TaxID=301880 RepID=A0ABQ4Z4M0_9ASTR